MLIYHNAIPRMRFLNLRGVFVHMLNIIPLSENNHLIHAVRTLFSYQNIYYYMNPSEPKVNLVIINDMNPLEGLLYIKEKNFDKFKERVIILSNSVTNKIAGRFVNEGCSFICLPQYTNTYSLVAAYNYLNDFENSTAQEKKIRFLTQSEKQVACELHLSNSFKVRPCLTIREQKKMSHRKYKLMKKLEVGNNIMLYNIISSPQFLRAIVFL
ncbi:UNVERIFIED_ORG: hypothetical protein J2Y78_004881 [Buttiauxella agrestis ATCC 33320]